MPRQETKWSVLIVAALVCAIVAVGSIGLVRYSNRDRAITPAITLAAQRLATVPDSLAAASFSLGPFHRHREQFAMELTSGALTVDSVKTFYRSYTLWLRDGDWDSSDVRELGAFLGLRETEQ